MITDKQLIANFGETVFFATSKNIACENCAHWKKESMDGDGWGECLRMSQKDKFGGSMALAEGDSRIATSGNFMCLLHERKKATNL